ncbi:MAG: AmmeMemoRadiSam system radical SAM enzyme [Candidatus Hadarchaeum sp.]|uniref:AmmeMemoRadiSam system radical SAM enzyme n=1 Tax=Candidatus Hadarchaeum sp. TaxID=2883567 RepID=UPI003D0F3C40
MKRPARFGEPLPGDKVRCRLCPRLCVIPMGATGYCRTRLNDRGQLYTLIYGSVTSMAIDPVEKKPLYHFLPGSDTFSIGTAGCNLSCRHCQNWTISQASIEEVDHENIPPERVVEMAQKYRCPSISYTYSEPSIWFEFVYDTAKLAHAAGIYNIYVTNGYMNIEAWEEIKPYLTAANVDVKAFSDDFYRRVCSAPGIEPVLRTCEWMVENGIHLETTYLIIPGENDRPEEIRNFCRWEVERLGPEVPTHFSRFFPMYRMTDREPTPVKTLELALSIAKEEGLHYVYIGNVAGHKGDNTYCPKCGKLLIERFGFDILRYEIRDHRCPSCGAEIKIFGDYSPAAR